MAIDQGALTYLYDAAPSLDALPDGDDRAVAAYGHSAAAGKRDRGRTAGFIPVPARWSGRGHDRGHLVAHGAGGGLDLNLFPQSAAVNRGWSAAGRRWRRLERYASRNHGTPLFVRTLYDRPAWTPAALELGLLIDGALRVERVSNR